MNECPECGNTDLEYIPADALGDPFDQVFCDNCGWEYCWNG